MKKYLRNNLLGIGLQFFAEEGDEGNPEGNANGGQGKSEGEGAGGQGTPGANHGAQGDGKSFTQTEVNTMMAAEKRTARNAVLKELGFDISDEKNFTQTMADIKKTLDAGKTQSQLDAEAKKKAEEDRDAAMNKANSLEMKVAALSAGVNPDYLDDIITLAKVKVSDTVSVEDVMKDLKTKYPTFFSKSGESGTGSNVNPRRNNGNGSEGLGQRLAKANKSETKSSYFKH